MSSTTLRPPPSVSLAFRLLPPALLAVLVLLPPETRGESQAGAAALLLLGTALALGHGPRSTTLGGIVLGAIALFPLTLASLAPGPVPAAWATLLLAGAAGVTGAGLRAGPGAGRALPAVLATAGALSALYGLFQVLFGLETLARRIEAEGGVADQALIVARARSGRAFAAFPTPAALGGLLGLALATTVGAALECRGRRRALWLGAAALQAVGLLATRSATAVAGLVGALVLLGLVEPRTRRRVAWATGAAVLVLASIIALRGNELLDPQAPGSPWRLRAGNFRIAASMTADHPWTGVGLGGFGEAYAQYRRPGDNATQHAHDLPLEWIAEVGLPAGSLLAGVFAWTFLGPLWSRCLPRPAARGMAVGLAALALQNLADFTALLPSLLWSAALLRGWLATSPPPAEEPMPRWLGAAVLGSVALASAVAALDGLAWNERIAARHAQAAGDRGQAADRLELATRLAPWNVDGWLWLGQTRLGLPESDAATTRSAAERAVSLAPNRPGARALRARLRLLDGDVPGAFADAAEAARLYPTHAEYAKERDEIRSRFRPALPDPGPR